MRASVWRAVFVAAMLTVTGAQANPDDTQQYHSEKSNLLAKLELIANEGDQKEDKKPNYTPIKTADSFSCQSGQHACNVGGYFWCCSAGEACDYDTYNCK